jgi:creatinine amidohydrolase
MGDQALVLPMLWISSLHHRLFPGTVSVTRDVYVTLLVDLLESQIDAGFRRIFMLNAHGGNIGPANAAIYDVQLRHRRVNCMNGHVMYCLIGFEVICIHRF